MTTFEAAIAAISANALRSYQQQFAYFVDLKAYSNRSIKDAKRDNIAQLKPQIAFLKALLGALEQNTLDAWVTTQLQTLDHGHATQLFSSLMQAIQTQTADRFQPYGVKPLD